MKKRILWIVICLAVGSILLLQMYFSLSFKIEHDSPLFLYISYGMARWNFVPFRDILDINMPGVYWCYLIIGQTAGYQQMGYRIVDLIMLVILMGVSFCWLKKIDARAAFIGAALFGIRYLTFGPRMSFQREYIALFFLIPAFSLSTNDDGHGKRRLFLAGIFTGIAVLIKPVTIIFLLPIILVEILSRARDANRSSGLCLAATLLALAAGLCVPIILLAVYLLQNQALSPFLDLLVHYWPLYNHINGNLEVNPNVAYQVGYINDNFFKFGNQSIWLIPAILGWYLVYFHASIPPEKRKLMLYLGMFLLCSICYAALLGKFWHYHWLIFMYFVIQLGVLCFVGSLQVNIPRRQSAILFCLAGLATVYLVVPVGREILERNQDTTIYGQPGLRRVDEIAAYLKANVGPGETVQPLDWTGGAVHAMLLADTRIATPFIYDFYFYHDIDEPYILDLRRRFLEALAAANPKIIIDIDEDKPWVEGVNTTRQFPDLQTYIEENYSTAVKTESYTLYRRTEESIQP
jgi:hypothetical protein